MNDFKKASIEELENALQEKKKEAKKQAESRIKNFESERDHFVKDTVEYFKDVQKSLKALKENSINKGNELYTEMYAMHGKDPKVCKQFSLIHTDGNTKIVLDRQEKMSFSDQAEVAIATIKEYFKNKFEDRAKTAYSMLNTLLEKNGKGDYDPKMLAKIRPHVNKIADPVLTEAFELLENSQVVSGSSLYLRAYEKDENDKWKDVVIQFSSL